MARATKFYICLVFSLLLIINLAPVQAQSGPILIATWNVRNFFDNVDDPMHEDSIEPDEFIQAKIRDISRTIKRINPDFIALQEVENIELLERLNKEGGLNYPNLLLVEGNDPRGIDVAVLTRLKVANVKTHKDDPLPQFEGVPPNYRFSRDCLEVHVEAGNTRFVALVNHFVSKSQGEAESLPKRDSQARRVRAIVDELQAADPSVKIIVLGDLNDTPDSIPLKRLIKGKPKTSKLFDASTVLPAEDRFSFVFRGNGELIDYALFNANFKGMLNRNSVRIIHDPDVDTASDHDPVVVGVNIQ